MDQINSRAQLTSQLMEDVNKNTPAPDERAQFVMNVIKEHNDNITNWDLLCFCVEYMGAQALVYPWLLEPAKQASRLVYMAHYLNHEQIDAKSGISKTEVGSGESNG